MAVKVSNPVEERISKNYNRLTMSEKRIAGYVLENLEDTAF